MNTLADRLKSAREAKGMDRRALSKASKVGYSTISELERGTVSTSSKTYDLAAALGVDAGWLATGKGQMRPEPSNVSPAPASRGRVPVISWVQAGNWSEVIDLFEPGDAAEWQSTAARVSQSAFALRVQGDSMAPQFTQGMILIVEPERIPDPGHYVIAKNGGNEATFKQLVSDGGVLYLKPINPQYPTMPLGDARIVGVVIEAVMSLA